MSTETVCLKTEPGEVCVKTEPGDVCVKEERECEDSVLRGVSAAAAQAGLYMDHVVKDELVLGPEEWHRPKVLPLQVCSEGRSARAREQLAMACSVVLERLPVDATAYKPYGCEHCGERFINKSILRKHIQYTDSSSGPKTFACNYKCNQKSSLKTYQRIHTGEKPYKCSHCDYKCNRG
ncbi:zinc finger protein 354A-like [Cydia amplana]|uniref:zinc finger protein 354A-like n=1 Tax=Cydia amplana TaxID=1869771 RepID=UPI002FE64B38